MTHLSIFRSGFWQIIWQPFAELYTGKLKMIAIFFSNFLFISLKANPLKYDGKRKDSNNIFELKKSAQYYYMFYRKQEALWATYLTWQLGASGQ